MQTEYTYSTQKYYHWFRAILGRFSTKKLILSETWTHPPTSIVISHFRWSHSASTDGQTTGFNYKLYSATEELTLQYDLPRERNSLLFSELHKDEGCTAAFILALKVILLDRLQGIICSGIQEPYLLGVML